MAKWCRLTSDRRCRQLNRTHRGLDAATDVLSFNAVPVRAGSLPPRDVPWGQRRLGTLVLGMNYIQKRCREQQIDVGDWLPMLLVHGVTHLLGYDHETDEEWRCALSPVHFAEKGARVVE